MKDPLSPYLFILCVKLLARQMHNHSFYNSKCLGVKLGRFGIKVPFLTFVDNIMLFAKATSKSRHLIKNILDIYCKMSG